MGPERRRNRPAWPPSRAVFVVGLLLLVQPVHAAEECAYQCAVVRWAAKNFSKEKIEHIVAQATPGQVAACRKCLRSNRR